MECRVNVKYQSELDIGGRETCSLTKVSRTSSCLLLIKIVTLDLINNYQYVYIVSCNFDLNECKIHNIKS